MTAYLIHMAQEEHSKVLPSDPPSYEETAKKDEIMYRENYKHFKGYHEAIEFITARLQTKSRRLEIESRNEQCQNNSSN